ncbi:MAG: hypothetical protein H6Q68_3722 [Firmicutes bacterium]|nr:hypothetical protein [Bacillota bacterium]
MHTTQSEKQDTPINRVIENFSPELAAQLRQVYIHIMSGKELRGWNPKWNIQFRPENKIFLYYRGNALVLTIYKKSNAFNVCSTNNTLKEKAPEIFQSSLVKEATDKRIGIAMEELFKLLIQENWLEIMEKVIDDNYKKQNKESQRGEEEREDQEKEVEQRLAAKLEGRSDFFVIDTEIRISGQVQKDDMLALQRAQDGTYNFVPIELKLSSDAGTERKRGGNKRNAVGQACEFCKTVKKNIDKFKESYKIIYNHKCDLGIFNGTSEIEILSDVMNPIVLVIGESNDAVQKLEKHAKDKTWNKDGEKGCEGCEAKNVCVVTVRCCSETDFINHPLGRE